VSCEIACVGHERQRVEQASEGCRMLSASFEEAANDLVRDVDGAHASFVRYAEVNGFAVPRDNLARLQHVGAELGPKRLGHIGNAVGEGNDILLRLWELGGVWE